MSVILERLGMTTGKKSKVGGGKVRGRENAKDGDGDGEKIHIPVTALPMTQTVSIQCNQPMIDQCH